MKCCSYYCSHKTWHYGLFKCSIEHRDVLLGTCFIKQRSSIAIITYLRQVPFNIQILVNVYLKKHQALTAHKQWISIWVCVCVYLYMKHAGTFSPSSCALGFINQCSDMKLHFYFSSYGCHHYHSKLRHTAPTPTSFITRLLFSLLLFVSLSPLLPPFPAQEVMSH